MSDITEAEVRLKIRQVFYSYYHDHLPNIEEACRANGISKATLYNYPKAIREEIQATVLDEETAFEHEREESKRRELLRVEAEVIQRGLPLILEGLDILADIMRNGRGEFNRITAYKEIRDTVRNELKPDKGKIVVELPDDNDKPALPAPTPANWLPAPGDVQPATDLRLASEIKTEATFEDGTTLRQTVKRPPVVDG